MTFEETKINGAFVVQLEKLKDHRGYFARAWCKEELEQMNLETDIKQYNASYNYKKGTLRGLHYQNPPYTETKYVRCTNGAVYDVIVDLRPESPTYKKWLGIELSAENMKMLYVPKGCAHGYLTLTDNAEVFYMVTAFYHKEAEGGVRYNDPAFNIEWPVEITDISDKDKKHPDFKG